MRALLATLAAAGALALLPSAAQAQPQITRTCNGSLVCSTWFTEPVLLDWTFTGSPTGGCVDTTLTQDTPGTRLGCIVIEAGETASLEVTLKLDRTAPDITAVEPDRPPDHDGWYSRPVTFAPRASDPTSGVAGCESVTYGGPDDADASVSATCRDVAGNVGARAFPLRYDATPPDPGPADVETGDRVVRLRWPAAETATIVRTPGPDGEPSAELYSGAGAGFTDRQVRNGERYRYVLTLADAAGNAASRELSGVPGPHLLDPARRASVAGPPRLEWTPVRGARYYNVQLFRDGRKILSAWPKRPELQLKPSWRFRGKRRRLIDGLYRWYVWPGEGPRSEQRYGKLIGRRSFVVG